MIAVAKFASALKEAGQFPWMPVAPGMSSRPLAFLPDQAGWAVLLKVEPGTRIGLHRHQGEVHGFVLSGRRRLSDGRVLGPGDYEYEPAGQTDTWSVEGDEPLVSLFVVRGPVEYLDAEGRVVSRDTAAAKAEAYRRFCAEQGLAPVALA
ncbi:MAG TPA: 2,4'-dihydroxyacetophenone dioxygenase family protein [Alphaproteobacteria bacterium]|jgi:anti-sigma factor ChrR (cupin superfamily)